MKTRPGFQKLFFDSRFDEPYGDLTAAAEYMLQIRAKYLFTPCRDIEIGTACVSNLEYHYFVNKLAAKGEYRRPDHRTALSIPEGEALKPIAGIRRNDAVSFCQWFSEWIDARTKYEHRYRLPSGQEARYDTQCALPFKIKDLDPEKTPTWCLDDARSVARSHLLEIPKGFQLYTQAVFRLDLYFTQYLNLMTYLRYGMPPKREKDWEFNENYEEDRRWITRYASTIDFARKALQKAGQHLNLDKNFDQKLNFNPWHNLSPSSPLDTYRDMIFDAYQALLETSTLEDGDTMQKVVAEIEASTQKGESFETERLCQEFEKVTGRYLGAPLDCEVTYERLNSITRDSDLAADFLFDPKEARVLVSAFAIFLDRATDRRSDLHRIRLLSLDNAVRSSNGKNDQLMPASKLFGQAPDARMDRPRDTFLEAYCKILMLAERMKETLPAWEGLRLVREPTH